MKKETVHGERRVMKDARQHQVSHHLTRIQNHHLLILQAILHRINPNHPAKRRCVIGLSTYQTYVF